MARLPREATVKVAGISARVPYVYFTTFLKDKANDFLGRDPARCDMLKRRIFNQTRLRLATTSSQEHIVTCQPQQTLKPLDNDPTETQGMHIDTTVSKTPRAQRRSRGQEPKYFQIHKERMDRTTCSPYQLLLFFTVFASEEGVLEEMYHQPESNDSKDLSPWLLIKQSGRVSP